MAKKTDKSGPIQIDMDADGCGFWVPIDGLTEEARPNEWWACAIPDAEHHGRDHVLVRHKREDAHRNR
jgi:hypothetical protein